MRAARLMLYANGYESMRKLVRVKRNKKVWKRLAKTVM
jgi:hypothetical protein